MKAPSRGEMLRVSGSMLLAGSTAGLLQACSSGFTPPTALTTGDISARTLDAIAKTYLADADAVSVGVYVDGTELTRSYVHGVPSVRYDEETVYGIGSNTKVFTASLLAHQCTGPDATRSLDDYAAPLLPPRVQSEGSTIKTITLRDLATHTSSFPDFISIEAHDTLFIGQPPPADQIQWWIDWDNKLATIGSPNPCLDHTPGTCWNYSDWGFVTLGFAVADSNRGVTPVYPDLLANVLTTPLGLTKTAANLTPDVKGHDANGKVVDTPPADLKSNARDLLRFLKANLGALEGVPDRLQRALLYAQQEHWKEEPKHTMGLAWQLPPPKAPGDPQLVWKNGEAGGYTSYLGMLPSKRMAIAILTNSDAANPTAAGAHFLNAMSGTDLPDIEPQ